jgi:SAM-dependent methyltransferase
MTEWNELDSFWDDFSDKLFTEDHWIRAEDEVNSVIDLLDIQQGSKILDLCCGPGRHSIELGKKGYSVTGVDRTLTYIKKAREQAIISGVEIDLITEDMRKFRRFNQFDVVLNLYTSFGYFSNPDDDKLVLNNVYSSLKSGGKFLMEMIGKEILARIFLERNWYKKGEVVYLEERKIEDGWEMISNKWILINDKKMKEYSFRHRLFSGAELSILLRDIGFKSVKLYGGLKGSPYDNTATRLVALASK